jgi:hypothetical protein
MLKGWTVANKFNSLVLLLALVSSVVVGGYIGVREYQAARDSVIAQLTLRANSGIAQQLAIYQRDPTVLNILMDDFFKVDGLRYVEITDQSGNLILDSYGPGTGELVLPGMKSTRAGVQALETALVSRTSKDSGERFLDLSLPLFSVVSPRERDLSRVEFLDRLAREQEARSLHVMGYLQFGISQDELLRKSLPTFLQIGLLCALFVLFSMLLS